MGDFNAYTDIVPDFVDIDVDFENNVFDMLSWRNPEKYSSRMLKL